jgi:hypothetical protein
MRKLPPAGLDISPIGSSGLIARMPHSELAPNRASTKEASVNTAQLHRPAPATAPATIPTPGAVTRRPSLLRRVGHLRHTSPGRLQLITALLVVLGLLVGGVAGLTARSAATGGQDLGERSQPLLVEAETIYSALADADATAAQAFLAGGLEPRALTERYDADLDRAAIALTSAARRAPAGGDTAKQIGALASGVSEYASLVATARANNRQGLPIGASYLSTASTLSRTQLLPQAQALFAVAKDDVDAGYDSARSTVWVSLLALMLIALLVGLLYAQRHLSRTTKRTFNVPLVAATVLTAFLAIGAAGVFTAQRQHLRAADANGSTPVTQLAEARILALKERGDEALTLAARSGKGPSETDFDATSARLSATDGPLAQAGAALDGAAGAAVRQAASRHTEYVAAHAAVRKLDDGGSYDEAVKLAIGPTTTATFTALTDQIGTALEATKTTFTDEISAAGRGLFLLTLLGPVLALVICALAVAGIRARLEEYR